MRPRSLLGDLLGRDTPQPGLPSSLLLSSSMSSSVVELELARRRCDANGRGLSGMRAEEPPHLTLALCYHQENPLPGDALLLAERRDYRIDIAHRWRWSGTDKRSPNGHESLRENANNECSFPFATSIQGNSLFSP